ncbi:hypothetical protein EON65_30840, partial [archaeon]
PYHLPRLDWCLWFVPFKPSIQACPRWLVVLCMCILEGNAEVLQLLHPHTAELRERLIRGVDSGGAVDSSGGENGGQVYLKVRLCRFEYASDPVSLAEALTGWVKSGGKRVEEAEDGGRREFWKVMETQQLLLPTTIEGLYVLYEELFEGGIGGKGGGKGGDAPSAETAQQIIMRTLFKKKTQKKKE